jgi:hypothetical protein
MAEAAFKVEETQKKTEQKKVKFAYFLDEDQTEIKKLDNDDVPDAVKIMQKCSFEVTESEVKSVVVYGMSYGCYVNRMLIGIGLSWPAHFDERDRKLVGGEPNAIYLEDPAVLLAYEGRGIRRMLLHTREDEGRRNNFRHAIAYLSEDVPKDTEIGDYIKEGGSALEKLYLSENYKFMRTERGIMAMKTL